MGSAPNSKRTSTTNRMVPNIFILSCANVIHLIIARYFPCAEGPGRGSILAAPNFSDTSEQPQSGGVPVNHENPSSRTVPPAKHQPRHLVERAAKPMRDVLDKGSGADNRCNKRCSGGSRHNRLESQRQAPHTRPRRAAHPRSQRILSIGSGTHRPIPNRLSRP